MIRKTPNEIRMARVLSLIAAAWAFVLVAYTVFDGSATLASVSLLALTGIALLTLSGSMYRGSPMGWLVVELLFFGVAALQSFMIMGGFVPAWGSLPVALVAVACGLVCSTYRAEIWIWRNGA